METNEEVALKLDEKEPDRLSQQVLGLSDVQCIEEAEKLSDMGDFQRCADPVIYTHQGQAVSVSLVPDIDGNERTNSCRIYVGNAGKVKDQIV